MAETVLDATGCTTGSSGNSDVLERSMATLGHGAAIIYELRLYVRDAATPRQLPGLNITSCTLFQNFAILVRDLLHRDIIT